MTEITEKTRISMEFKYMVISIIFMITSISAGVTGYVQLKSSVEQNTGSITKLTRQAEQHQRDYQAMNNAVTKLTVTTKQIEKNTDEIKETLKYLTRKEDSKK